MMNNYSNKDMTGWNLSDRTDMDGLVISNSCLSNEVPDARVLPENLTGATFIECNLDNVFIPDGNTLIRCSTRRIEVQNDGNDWVICPDTYEPLEPVNLKAALLAGDNINPAAIPDEKVGE